MFSFFSRIFFEAEARRPDRHASRSLSALAVLGIAGLWTGSLGLMVSAQTDPSPHRHHGVPNQLPEHPAVGEKAPEFSLADLQGRRVALGEFLGRGYLVLLFGSATSEDFRREIEEIESRRGTWSRWEVQILGIYTREAHPGRLRGAAPQDYPERVALARKTRDELSIDFPLLIDGWEDTVHKAYGAMPHAAFLLDSDGTIVSRQARVNTLDLDRQLRRLLRVEIP